MPNKAIEKELVELEKKYWQALKDHDVDAALQLTDDSCIMTGPQGVSRVERSQFADMMKSASYTLDSFELKGDPEVTIVGDDVALLAYKVRSTYTLDGKPVTVEAADTSTWVRRNGKWVCALHTESLLGDPFGRDRAASGRAAAAL